MSVRAVTAQVGPGAYERFAPDCKFTIADDAIVRGPGGKIIGRVVGSYVENDGIRATLEITDPEAWDAMAERWGRWNDRPKIPYEDSGPAIEDDFDS